MRRDVRELEGIVSFIYTKEFGFIIVILILTDFLGNKVAPEVVLCKHYGKPADIFSFSILLWEILALKQPFKGYDYEKHAKLVVQKGKRPDVKKEWATLIRSVIKRGWDNDPSKRPTFDQICDSLAGEFSELDHGLSRTQRLLHRESNELRFFRNPSS